MATGSSPITVPGLTNGTAYTFTVTGANSAGTGTPSATSNQVTPKATQTISFANPGAQNFGTTPTLAASSSAGASYPVTFASSTMGVCTVTPTGALTFVTAGTCTIAADQAGDAAIGAAPQVTQSFAVNAIAPDIPVIGTVTAADAQATVNFTASVGSGGAPISGYTVTATPVAAPGAPAVTTQTGTASPIVVTGLTNGFVYNFTVKATNGAQTSADSAAVQATPRKLELVGAPGSVPGMSGTPTATLSGGGATCTLQATGGFGPAASTPPGLQAPNGQFAFTAEQCTGAVTMTLVYPSPLPVDVQFRKPDGAGGWFDPTNAATSLNVVLNAARTTVSYTITDNGLGDTNPATGSVSDPFVPVVAAVAPGGAQAIPSLGGWALAMLSGLLGGLALRSRKVFTARR
ncbi:fibronectin type III domain-containing protein [Delftia sp. BR1]|nr:fibronectin type III domain-containing protein [Delftia sp. BR1]